MLRNFQAFQIAKKCYISFGSLRECEAILELEQLNNKHLQSQIDRLGKMLYALSKPKPKLKPDAKPQTANIKPPTRSLHNANPDLYEIT